MPTASDDLTGEVMRHGNRVYALVRRLGRDDLAERIRSQAARWGTDQVPVVVAGDVKRGKTSLINAVLERPGLLPVDADVATSVQLLVHHAEQPSVVVTRRGEDGGVERLTVSPAELGDYASMQGDPRKRSGVSKVEVGVPHELLRRGLAIVDTPGVGSMTRGHRDVTMAALNVADALLFAVSCDAPVLRSELDFLAEAVQRIDTVVLVLTKVDTNPRWRELLAENRARMQDYAGQLKQAADLPDADDGLRAAAGRFARLVDDPVLPVSSQLARTAHERLADGRVEAGSRLLERSGIGALVARLEETAGSHELLRLTGALQLSTSVLAKLEDEEQDRVRGAEQNPELDARLATEQAELRQLGSQHARWRPRFVLTMQQVQAEATRSLHRELGAIDLRYRDQLRATAATIDDLADDLQRSLVAAWSTVATLVGTELERAVAAVGRDLGIEELKVPLDELVSPEALRELDLRAAEDDDGHRIDWIDDGIPAVMTTSLFGTTLAATALSNPAGWAIGGLVAAGIGIARYRRRERQRARAGDLQQLREALASVRQECSGELSTRLVSLRLHLEDEIEQRLAALEADLDRRRAVLRELVQENAARRRQAKAESERRLIDIRTLRGDADALRGRAHAGTGRA